MRIMRSVLALAAIALVASPAAAWPDRPIKMIVPFSAGGSTDVTARILAEQMSEVLGQQVIVENKPGAGGTIGTEEAARATPDGYTVILQTSSSSVINVWLYQNLAYDPVASFRPVALATRLPNVLVVNPAMGVRTLPELIGKLQAEPDTYTYGSSGNGTILHLSGYLFAKMANVEIEHVPYGGAGPAMTDLLAGHIDMMVDNLPTALGHIQSGALVPIGITTRTRSPVLPDVPTLDEAGLAGYETYSWTGIFAPAGVPDDVVARIQDAALAALADPDTRKKLEDLGNEVLAGDAAALDIFWKEQLALWKPIVEGSGVTIE